MQWLSQALNPRRTLPRFVDAFFVGSVTFTTFHFTIFGCKIRGSSMLPTIQSQEYVLVHNWSSFASSKVHEPDQNTKHFCSRGDVAIFWSPTNPNEKIVKRIVAREGDIVQPRSSHSPIKVPPGYVWVEGDNQFSSIDSNDYGPIPMGLFIGKASHVIFPLSHWKKLTKEYPADRVIIPVLSQNTLPSEAT